MKTNQKHRIVKMCLLSVFLLFIGGVSYAQSEKFNYKGHLVELDKRVAEHYGVEYVNDLKINNPDLLLYLNYFVANAYKVEDIGEKASSPGIKSISSISRPEKSRAPLFSPNILSSFNILAFGIQLTAEQQVFLTGNGSQAIVVIAKQKFFENYNNYRDMIIK